MTARRSRVNSFSEALENLASDATAPEQTSQEALPPSSYMGVAPQINASGGNFSEYTGMFSDADLERLFGMNPRVDISQLDLDSPNVQAEHEPTREEVVATNYPEFAENEGIDEVPTEEIQQETY